MTFKLIVCFVCVTHVDSMYHIQNLLNKSTTAPNVVSSSSTQITLYTNDCNLSPLLNCLKILFNIAV